MDCHYTSLEESEIQEILHNLRGQGKKPDIEDDDRAWSYDTGLCFPLSDGAIVRKLQATGLSRAQAVAAVQASADIGAACNVTLPKLDPPLFPLPDGYTGDIRTYWREKIREGWRQRGLDRLHGSEMRRYRERLRYEVDLIESKNFENYFLIVSDAIQFLKNQGIPVGPARGSAAASLTAYVLRITEVDPMQFPLLVFERFIDVNRDDLPDIDIDLPSEVRDHGILREYLQSKYPSVANIGTFTYFKGKLALDDVARYGHVPQFEVDNIKQFLIERSSGDLRANATVQDTIDQFPVAADVVERFPVLRKAELLEGNVKGSGVHAAAYVVANGDIRDVTAVYRKKIKDVYAHVVCLDKYDAERQGLLKIDFLGLSTMSALWDMCKWVGMTPDDLYNIDLKDEHVYDVFRQNDVTGVFQFDGRALRSVCQIVKPDTFDEIMACNALSRPGPLHNGAASAFAAIKFGQQKPERVHPALDRITEPTQFQIVYQEQIMRIVRELGDFPWTSVAYIRKIIARKLGEQEFMRQWDRFWAGCQTLDKRMDVPPITQEQALSIWRDCVTSGSYAFNAAHCCAYGLLAYWTAFFKNYHPEAFFAASAKHYTSREHDMLRDAARHGLEVRKPSIRKPQLTWSPASEQPAGARTAIRAGLTQIDGFGDKKAELLMERPLRRWSDILTIKGVGPKTHDKIRTWLRQDDPFGIYELENSIAAVKESIANGELVDDGRKLPMPTHTSAELDEARQGSQVVWIGRMVKKNIRDIFEVNAAKKGEALNPEDVRDPHLREFAILYARDEDDQTMVKIDRWRWPRFKNIIFNLEPNDILVVQGRKPRYGIMANKIWVVSP
jgi:DNA polymerase-3 subunit alpha